MFKLSEIKELMKLMDQTNLQDLEIENEGARLVIRKGNKNEPVIVASPTVQQAAQLIPSMPQVQAPAPTTTNEPASVPAAAQHADLHKIVSPMVGTFYEAPAPGAAPFVSIGSKVSDKTVVCIVEAMKLMNEIEAEVKGEIVEILVKNGELVEYGQPLFLVKPE